jgi:hypothetical protein
MWFRDDILLGERPPSINPSRFSAMGTTHVQPIGLLGCCAAARRPTSRKNREKWRTLFRRLDYGS